ncbi:MAG TPA: PD-(D/E)XK nuclease superfamily protein [Kofleriaceae bacterium]|jgi:hypothetical protein|nr:PD-(D/E)XK nuclease superfamily protein [Kofleriaceae bacterium]
MATTNKPPSRSKLVASKLLGGPKGPIAALKAGAAPNLSKQTLTAMTGNGYRDLIASYIHQNYAPHGLDVYVEISLGKTIIGKDRFIDIFVVRPEDRKAIALECKYQDSQGTVDEKIPYALADLEALWMPGLLVYAGTGWSKGVMHSLEASRLAAYCLPDPTTFARGRETRELDHILASVFGFWDLVLPPSKRFRPAP